MTENNKAGLFFIGLAVVILVLHTMVWMGPLLALGYWLTVSSIVIPIVIGIRFFIKDIEDEQP